MAPTLGERGRVRVSRNNSRPPLFLIIESAESIRALVPDDQGLLLEKLSVTHASSPRRV
jgi:hypothetical protein